MRRGQWAAMLWVVVIQIAGSAWAATPTNFADAMKGHWIGTLEYRDYSNDRRVTLPTQLDIDTADDGALDFHYVYDDGPSKTVRETSHVSIDSARRQYVITDGDERDVYRIVEQHGFSGTGTGQMLLSGTGKENNRAAKIRTSIVRNDDGLTIVRESQLPGEPFKFRHQYRFVRRNTSVP